MNVIQNIHGIAELRLTVVEERDTAEAGHYWVRSLIVTGRYGEEFRVELFGDSPQALTLISERLDAYAVQARDSADASDEYLAQPPDGTVDLAASAAGSLDDALLEQMEADLYPNGLPTD